MAGSSSDTAEDLASEFSRYSVHRGQFEKAIETVLTGSVKAHVFLPSGRVLNTVVGRSGEEFIDPVKPFCSCKNFFFGVLGGRNGTCYHLLSYSIAEEAGKLDKVRMHDEEFESFVSLLIHDLVAEGR